MHIKIRQQFLYFFQSCKKFKEITKEPKIKKQVNVWRLKENLPTITEAEVKYLHRLHLEGNKTTRFMLGTHNFLNQTNITKDCN